MNLLRTLLILVVALTITADASAAKAKKKKKNSGLEGVVTAIESGSDDKKDTGTITVKMVAGKKKKKNAAPAGDAAEKKIQVTKESTFEKVSGKKGQLDTKPASFSDLQKNGQVRVTLKAGTQPDTAEKVQLVDSGKKKKKKKNI